MLLAPRRSSSIADLLRLTAAWLVLILLFEGFSVGQSRAAGPLHRHRAPAGVSVFVHTHAHQDAARHYHYAAAADGLMTAEEVASLDEALDAATSALSVAFALLAVVAGIHLAAIHAGRVWRASGGWAWLTIARAPLLRPPRPA